MNAAPLSPPRMKFPILLRVVLFFSATALAFAQPLAFPSAEGFGRFAVGGRGGDARVVQRVLRRHEATVGEVGGREQADDEEREEAEGHRVENTAVDPARPLPHLWGQGSGVSTPSSSATRT